jgi:hypothetical protein
MMSVSISWRDVGITAGDVAHYVSVRVELDDQVNVVERETPPQEASV